MNVTDYTLANEHFHSTLVRIGGNAPLAAMLDQLRTPLYRFQFRTRLTAEGLTRGHADHVEIAEAVLAGDPDRAERAMRRHLRNSAKLIDALPDDAFG